MANIETWFDQDLMKPVQVRNLGNIFNQDSLGNLIGVRVKKNGEDFTLSGAVNGYCIIADGSTVPVVGTRSGNKASIILPASAYSINGPIAIAIKLTDGNAITTLAACVGIVTRSRTGVQIDPGQTVTDWTNQIAAELQAVQDAADNLGAQLAAPFSTSTAYTAGTYVTYNGVLYRFTTDHAAGEWNNSHVTTAKVGTELSDLKSAINDISNGKIPLDLSDSAAVYINGKTVGSAITFKSSENTTTYKKIIPVTEEESFKIVISEAAEPSSVGARHIVITDANDIVKQVVEYTNVAGGTTELEIEPVSDGFLYVSVANNIVDIAVYSGLLFETSEKTKELESDITGINNEIDAIIDSSELFEGFAESDTENATYYSGGIHEWGTTTKRLLNTSTLSYPIQVKFECATGYEMYVYTFAKAYTFTGNKTVAFSTSSGLCTECVVPANSNIMIVLRKSNDGTVSSTDWANGLSVKPYPTDLTILARSAETTERNANMIENLTERGYHIVRTVGRWNQGTINATTGENSSANNRCRTYSNEMLRLPSTSGIVKISVPEGYQIGTRIYENGIYKGAVSFTGGQFDLPVEDKYSYRFILKKTDDSDFSPDDFSTEDITFDFWTLDNEQSVVTRNNPVEMRQALQQLKRKTRISGSAFGTEPLCLLHFSDIHGDHACLKNIIEFKEHYSEFIDDIIHTGDMVNYTSEDGILFWDADGVENILNVIGNHDTRAVVDGTASWTALDMETSYTTYFAPYISNWGVTNSPGLTYYYKDYADQKVRLIVLDIMHQTAEQLSWFVSTLNDARSNNLHVICAVHSRAHWTLESYDTTWDDKINAPSYQAGYSDTSNYSGPNYPSNLADGYASAVDDFIEAGGYFICWMHGHTHFKMFAKLPTHTDQLNVAVANAGGSSFANTYVWEREIFTKTMDDFNLLAIDTTAKILRIYKVGVDRDRYMRHVGSISYDYENRQLIYSD